MTDRPADPGQATARSPIAGCSILIVAVLVMVFLVGFSTLTLFRQYNEIEKFTATEPATIQVDPLEDREAELNRLAERVEGFRQELQSEDGEAVLELSADDINLAIAAFDPLEELRGTFRVEEIGAKTMEIAIAFQLNGRPRLTEGDEEGWITSDPRFLNGTMIARPRLLSGEIVLSIDQIEVPGVEVPDGFIGQMSPYRITQRYVIDPEIGPAMKRLTSLELVNGQLVLRRVPGETPADTITDEQVDTAAGRLFTVFAIGASIFLVVVGLVLFLGLKAKGRRA